MRFAMKIGLAVMFLAIVATAVAFGQAEPQYGGTLVVASSQTFVGFNPMFDRETYSGYVIDQVFDSLITTNPNNGKPAPYLADSWEISKDGSQITFHLHHGVKFHNGAPLTAKDVKFTYDWVLNKENASPGLAYLSWLKEVRVVDDYTVKFILKPESTPFPPAVLSCNFGIVPKDTFIKMGKDAFREHPVGSGPFIFKEWVKGDHVTLVRNDNYWLKKPYLEKVIFRPIPTLATAMLELESGGVDITDNVVSEDIPRFKKMKDVNILQAPSLSYFWLGFNLRKAPFNDIRFRKAVYESFSMDDAVQSIFHGLTGERTYGVIPPPMWANDEAYLKTLALPENDKDADRLFNELRKEGVIPKGFSVTVYAPPDPRRVKLATIVATALKAHGIDASVQSLEWGSYMSLLFRSKENPTGDYGMYLLGWSDQPDPHFFLWYLADSVNARVGGYNSAGFSDPVVDYLLEKGDTSLDPNVRELAYVAAQRLFIRSYAHIPAYRYIETRGVRARVHGFYIGITGGIRLCDPFTNVWVEPKARG